jgi:hypothetical protein
LLELEGSTSNDFYKSLTSFLIELGLDMGYIVSLGTDRATSMTSRINELAMKLKRCNPFMTSIHCIMSHKTNLCLVDVFKSFPMVKEIDDIMNDIASIFTKSATQTTTLR